MTAKSGSKVGELLAGTGAQTGGGAGRGRRLLAAAALLLAAVSQPGCGKKTTLSVRVVTPPGAADPFLSATTVRMTQGTNQVTAAVSSGKFQVDLELDAPPTDQFLQILVEALDSSAAVVARGITPNFDPQNSDVAVYVNRSGQVGATDLQLPDDMFTTGSARGRRELMGAALMGRQVVPAEPAIGGLIVGGAADDLSLVSEAVMYKTLSHQLIDAGSPSSAGQASGARRGGVLVPSADATSGQQAVLWGGVQAGGEVLPTHADKFDPAVSTLAQVWALPSMPYVDAGGPGAYAPAAGQLGGVALICGGLDAAPPKAGAALAQAVVVRRNAPAATSADQGALLGVTRVPAAMDGTGPMKAARYLHTVTSTADGGTGFVFGGLSADDSKNAKPVAEVFAVATSSFKEFAFMPPTSAPKSRRGHVAARLTGGQILIAGGYTYDMTGTQMLDGSGLIIALDGAVTTVMQLLKTPRYAASVTTSGGELIICGGFGADGKALKDCEVLAADSGLPNPSRGVIPLPNARAGHLALTLENGLTLLVGGVADQNGPTLSSIDIYSALR